MEYRYKIENALVKRVLESQNILFKYPDRIPVIVETFSTSTPTLSKNKFIVPKDLSVGQFLYILRKKIQLDPKHSIYLFVRNILPPISKTMSEVYQDYRDVDGFLYLSYTKENTFG